MAADRQKTVLVTGASAGIGRAFAEQFAAQGWDVAITARRENQLQSLAEHLRGRYQCKVTVIVADLAQESAPQDIFDYLADEQIQVDALVNNAGYGVPGNYVTTDWAQQKDFIQVLVTSVAHLCHLFLPGMVERNYGRIINVSSLNGLLPCSPGQSLYASAKSFVVNLSHTLQAEAADKGVHVCALCPGFTYTEFHDVTGTRDMVSKIPESQWLDAETVAKLGYEAVMRGDPLCVTGRSSKITATLTKFLPRTTMISLLKKQSKRFRKVE